MKAHDVGAILLAAGRSSRFGPENKLAASFQGRPLVLHVAETLSALEFGQRIVVCSEPLPVDWSALGFEEVRIPGVDPMSASIVAGVEHLRRTSLKACLIALADMPFVPATHFENLIMAVDGPVVATACNGMKMVPALFERSLWGRLAGLTGDIGARAILEEAKIIEASPAWLKDIDVPEDFIPD